MGFTNYLGLLGLLFIPLIILLYMLRPKNKPYKVPSLYLWQYAMEEIEAATRIKKLKSSILMILQILIVVIISLMLSGLFKKDIVQSEHVVVVMDCSISMKSEDIKPNRMSYGKRLAIDYINQLSENTTVTLISLKDVPEITLSKEKNKQVVENAINNLKAYDTVSNLSLVEDVLVAVKGEDTQVVYFGDQVLANATNYRIKESDYNILVNNIVYTRYDSSQSITALVKVHNYSQDTQVVPISLYVDNVFFGAKEIKLNSNASGSVYFEDIPFEAKELKAEADIEDILLVDNTAFAIIHEEKVKRIALVSASNTFIERLLRLDEQSELYLVEPGDADIIKGYDLYIFDGVMPAELPDDGALLIYDYDSTNYFDGIGYVEYPELLTTGHIITEYIERPEFRAYATRVYDISDKRAVIYETEFGASVFTTEINGRKGVVFGFDIHQTDLPLSIEFPIMMVNLMDYLVPSSLVNSESVFTGDDVFITINPNITKAYVILPNNHQVVLDISSSKAIFTDTDQSGIYTLVEERKGEPYVERFAVNINKNQDNETIENNSDGVTRVVEGRKSLYMILGMILLFVMVIEWSIYSYRRKINGSKL